MKWLFLIAAAFWPRQSAPQPAGVKRVTMDDLMRGDVMHLAPTKVTRIN